MEASGFVATRNAMGYMTTCLDPYSSAFTRHCLFFPEQKRPSLDIGAAFGVASLEALSNGAHVVSNDIDATHLATIKVLAPEHARTRLTLDCQPFPGNMEHGEGAFSAILASRVLHFLTVPQLVEGAAKLARWLAPGGHLFVVEDSPYLGNSSGFIDTYEARVRAGEAYPGMCLRVDRTRTTRASTMPDFFHFFDAATLTRVFEQAGLEVLNCRSFPRLDYPADVQLDGREGVGLIAAKR